MSSVISSLTSIAVLKVRSSWISTRAFPALRIERLAEKETGPVSELQIDGLAAFGRMHKLKKVAAVVGHGGGLSPSWWGFRASFGWLLILLGIVGAWEMREYD